MISRTTLKWLAFAAGLAAGVTPLSAQDNSALLNALVRKGILTDQEADDMRADLAKENVAALASTSKSTNLEKFVINGRIQSQFVSLQTDTGGAVPNPAASQHFFLRRVYIGFKPQFSANWSAYLNYDFAGSTFDAAHITWAPNPLTVLDVGFRKVPFGYDENFISSGALKAIERSPITRFFVESNNGRRLGGGSYRQGLFLGGTPTKPTGGFSYNIAVTNPERDESASGAAGVGNANNNTLSYWANVGYLVKFGDGLLSSLKAGASAGLLPDQGGPANTNLGRGHELRVYSAYADLYLGKFSLIGEYYWSENQRGVSLTKDAGASGYWIQPSYRFGPYEPVVRFSSVDSDGRGTVPGDLVRSAPNASGLTFDKLNEWYFGVNWYLVGNDLKHEVKLQAGYILSQSKDRLTGAATVNELETRGFRSQLQVNF